MNTAVFYWVNRPQQLGWKIANYIANTLDVPFYADTTHFQMKNPDIFIYVNGLDAFADPEWRAIMAEASTYAEHFVYVQNDYMLHPPIAFRDAYAKSGRTWKPIYWSTIPDKISHTDQWRGHPARGAYINWNQLGYQYLALPQGILAPRQPGLLYYGDLRPGRQAYLLDYFGEQVPYPTYISAPEVSHREFRTLLGPSVNLLPPFPSLYEQLTTWDATVYLEDTYSHRHHTSPATRFYECLATGVAQFVDEHAAPTLAQDFLVEEFVVHGPQDLAARLPTARQVAEKQQALFASVPSHFHRQLQNSVLRAFASL